MSTGYQPNTKRACETCGKKFYMHWNGMYGWVKDNCLACTKASYLLRLKLMAATSPDPYWKDYYAYMEGIS